ncbi:hypothetical protein JCM19037_1408 [Geomicrobium sp. JCM 19037]|uniref:hypothetical protein n=1 Tax=Geomicrobium sp. JCM 19037 TaxID=1460634 RepID=UPI00045F31A1|nr:hypothetical protein [Geomicrobium sp. JCM 19037]GAK03115.1 hypothetical protein JCM19037_1408 [Geomicrobium sp. JCM 19037]
MKAGGQLKDLDPSSQSFNADLESAIKSSVESNPKLKASQPRRAGATPPDNQNGDGNGLDMNSMIRQKAGR